MKILVTDGSFKNTLGIVRSLGRRGVEVSVLCNSKYDMAGLSKYCKNAIIAPDLSDDSKFIPFILNYLQNNEISLLIPVGGKSTEVISQHEKVIKQRTSLELSKYDTIQIALNRESTYKLAEKLQVPFPHTYYGINQDNVVEVASKLKYPVVIKRAHETAERYLEYAFDEAEFINKYCVICNRYGLNAGSLPVVQEYIKGPGYGFFALYQNGVCKRVFMHQRIREAPPSGGISIYAKSCNIEKLNTYGRKLLDALNWHGVAMVEFKLDTNDNEFKLMEINPKFWGSLDLAIASGVDFPYLLYEMHKGMEISYSDEYLVNLHYHWPLEELIWARRYPSVIFPMIIETLNPKVKSNVSIEDAKPFWISLVHFYASMILSAFRRIFRR